MDLSAILPLLMNKSGMGGDKMNTIMKMAGGGKPDINTVMDMMDKQKRAPMGLAPISSIASDEIFGKMARYFIKN